MGRSRQPSSGFLRAGAQGRGRAGDKATLPSPAAPPAALPGATRAEHEGSGGQQGQKRLRSRGHPWGTWDDLSHPSPPPAISHSLHPCSLAAPPTPEEAALCNKISKKEEEEDLH